MTVAQTPIHPRAEDTGRKYSPGDGDCWNHIGIAGDRTCPELIPLIHCRNCPVFAAAAQSFFNRPAPEGYLAEWSRWLASSGAEEIGDLGEDNTSREVFQSTSAEPSALIFRLGT